MVARNAFPRADSGAPVSWLLHLASGTFFSGEPRLHESRAQCVTNTVDSDEGRQSLLRIQRQASLRTDGAGEGVASPAYKFAQPNAPAENNYVSEPTTFGPDCEVSAWPAGIPYICTSRYRDFVSLSTTRGRCFDVGRHSLPRLRQGWGRSETETSIPDSE